MTGNNIQDASTLEGHLLRGSAWLIALRWSLRLSGLLSTVILARLLSPADYGVVAIASIIAGSIDMFAQTGQYRAIIRHPNPAREHYDSAWTVFVFLGLLLGAVILAATPITTLYFHEPRATPVLQVLAARTALMGFQNIGVLNFRKYLQFHKQFLFEVYPSLLALFVTVTSALIWRNYWALVAGIISQNLCALVLSYTMEPFRPRVSFSKVREIWSFSVWTMLRNIGTFANTQVDRIAVGGVFGAATMGRYDVAQDIAISPSQEIINPLVAVLFPVISLVQGDVAARRRLFLNALSWSALICVSTSVGVALVHSDLVDLVLGRKWEAVKPLMPWFAFAFGILGLSNCVYPALESVGRAYMAARLQWLRVLALALGVFPAAYLIHDVTAVAIARLVVTVIITPTLFYVLGTTLHLSSRDFISVLWRPFSGGVAMAIVVMGVNTSIGVVGSIRLLLDVLLGSSTYILVVMLLWMISDRPEGPEQMVWRRSLPIRSFLRGCIG